MRLLSLTRACAVAATAGTALLLAGATGAVAAVMPEGPTQTLSVVLTVPDPAALAALARTTGLSHDERMARLLALEPSAAEKQEVVDGLTAAGVTVTDVGPWMITAQASTSTVTSRFGGRVQSARVQSLPTKPASLDRVVSGVYTSADTGARHKHMSLPFGPTGQTLRTSYAATSTTSPTDATIATLQFSGWDSGNLTSYASAIGVADPVASGRYVGVAVSPRATTNRITSDGDGDGEVALDQESMLSIAPSLRQRAYFAENTFQGDLAALQQIAIDASDPSKDIIAMSVSWGMCEDSFLDAEGAVDQQSLSAEVNAYNAIAATGVTIFSSSGDAGAFDCSEPGTTSVSEAMRENVDTPGSYQSVISVGGSSVQFNDVTTPADDVETVWAAPANGTEGEYLGDGGGGGTSELIATPSYQSSLAPAPSMRTVPDISAMADPNDTFAVMWSRGGGWQAVGGTSLSAPLSAALFAGTLVSNGVTSPVGDIHPLLYNDPTYSGPHQSFRDITSGDNSFGLDPTHAAKVGYDLSSGLGAPQWGELVTRLLSKVQIQAPTATHTTTVPITATLVGDEAVTGWKVAAVDATSPDPGCLPAVTATANPPSSVTLPGGDGAKTIYVVAVTSSSTCITGHQTVTLDTVAPQVSASATRPIANSLGLSFTWSGSDRGTGIDHYVVTISHSLQSSPDVSMTTTTRSTTLTGVQGRTYTLKVVAFDGAGNSTTTTSQVDEPLDDTYLSARGTWKKVNSLNDFGGSARVSSTKSSQLNGHITFRTLAVQVATGASNGRVDVYIDGSLYKTIDTYSATTGYRKVYAVVSFPSTLPHDVQLRVRGDKNGLSRGVTVVIDALLLHS